MNNDTEKIIYQRRLCIKRAIAVLRETYDACDEYEFGCKGCEATRVIAFLEGVLKEL